MLKILQIWGDVDIQLQEAQKDPNQILWGILRSKTEDSYKNSKTSVKSCIREFPLPLETGRLISWNLVGQERMGWNIQNRQSKTLPAQKWKINQNFSWHAKTEGIPYHQTGPTRNA